MTYSRTGIKYFQLIKNFSIHYGSRVLIDTYPLPGCTAMPRGAEVCESLNRVRMFVPFSSHTLTARGPS